jgi:glycosyltransferase involved in cell wall biosynthesis
MTDLASESPKPPRVSVIVTVYNRTGYLEQAIVSALNQTYADREVIVVDDSGGGVAREVCETYLGRALIGYRAHTRTLGIAAGLREAIREARGTYIAVLNDDDFWAPDFLAKLVPRLEADGSIALAFCDHWIVDQSGAVDTSATDDNSRRYGRAQLAPGLLQDPARFIFQLNGVPLAMAAVFRKSAVRLELLADEVSGAYDFWISCLLAGSGGGFTYHPERLTFYRVHGQMETARRSPDKAENLVYIFSKLLELGWFTSHQEFLKFRLGQALLAVGKDQMYFGHLGPARALLYRAFLTSAHWKPIALWLLSFLPSGIRRSLALAR